MPEANPETTVTMLNMTRRALLALPAMFLAALATPSWAETFPSRAMTLVVPFSPGGVTDSAARIVARRLGERLGQPVVVENRAGAGGAVATEYVARSKADGYTLLFGSRVTQVTNPMIHKTRLPTEKDFTPIYTVCDAPAIVVVNAKSPLRDIKQLVAHAKANPGKVNIATAGNGTAAHLAALVFMELTRTSMTHVPYRGSSPAIQDLLAGNVEVAFDYPSSTLGFIRAGSLRALASLSEKRLAVLPDVPTIAEAGVGGAESSSWLAIFVPGRTPGEVSGRLINAMEKVMKEPDVQKQLSDLGTVPMAVGGKALQGLLDREVLRWRPVVSKAAIATE